MQQRLYLTRHAHALDDAASDSARPLSPKGVKQCERLCQGLSRLDLGIESIWHSGLVRARETAQALADGLGLQIGLIQKDGFAPYDNPVPAAALLNESHNTLLVAGHEPNLSALASLLLAGHTDFQRVVFPKASVLCLSRMKVGSQATPWLIEWHLNHKFFKR